MIRKLACAVVLLAGLSKVATAQPSNPSPARNLLFYVGTWSARGQMRDAPTSDFKAVTGSETCRWAAGGAAVLCEEKETGPGGGWNGVYLLGYDTKQGVYTLYGIESPGTIVRGTGKLENNVWTWTAESIVEGAASPSRYVFKGDGNNARTMTVEAPDASGKWFTVLNHRYTRTK